MNKRQVGAKYEAVAAEYLKGQGYLVVECNHRNPLGEVDLILEKDGVVIYAEVKYRGSSRYGDPLEAVDWKKQKRVSRAAAYHYNRYGAREGKPCRFDVIGIYGDGRIRHIADAFEFQG